MGSPKRDWCGSECIFSDQDPTSALFLDPDLALALISDPDPSLGLISDPDPALALISGHLEQDPSSCKMSAILLIIFR